MAINPTPYIGDFLNKLFDVISSLEQSKYRFDGGVHNDGLGVPTLGYGYALLVRQGNLYESTSPPTIDGFNTVLDDDDNITGGDAFNDFIDGRGGNDTIHGDASFDGATGDDDWLVGGTGRDQLAGDESSSAGESDGGNDLLEGGCRRGFPARVRRR
jgi:hypothetical protein